MIYVFILCVLFVYVFLNVLLKKTNYYQNMFSDVLKFDNVPDSLMYLNVGSSFAYYAFDYLQIQEPGFNFAINGQNLEYDLLMLKQYQSKVQKGAHIFIVCADLEFLYVTNDAYYRNVRFYKYYRNVLDKKKIPFFLKYYVGYILFPLLRHPMAVKYIFRDVPRYDKFSLDYNPLSRDEIIQDAQRRISGWERMFKIENWNIDEVLERHIEAMNANIKILKEIINFCNDNEWQPYVIIPPLSETLNEMIPLRFQETYLYRPIKELKEKLDFGYYDFSHSEELQSSDNYINAGCLNSMGRKKFWKLLMRYVEEKG